MSDFSLMPAKHSASSKIPLKPQTLKTVVICAVLIVAALVGQQLLDSRLQDAQRTLDSAKAEQAQMKLKTDRVQKQLGDLQGAGGASKLDLVRGLVNARMDWKGLILAIVRASSPGITISGFTGSAPASTTAAGSGSVAAPGATLPLSGSANSLPQLQGFVRALRAAKVGSQPAFSNVQLNSSSQAEGSGRMEWSMTLTLIPPPPAPDPGSSSSSGSSTPQNGGSG